MLLMSRYAMKKHSFLVRYLIIMALSMARMVIV